MRFIISGKNPKVIVTLSVEKERQKIEVTIPVKGSIIRSEQVSNDMYVSIDLVEEVIERQLRKYRKKIIDRHQSGGSFQPSFMESEYDLEEDSIEIIRTPASRWSCWDTASSYSTMRRRIR